MAKSKRKVKPKRKIETSKKLAVWAVCIASLSCIASYVLAALNLQTVSDVTTTVFTACIGYLITYAGKSLGEKVSRNKHRLDENGKPYEQNGDDNND